MKAIILENIRSAYNVGNMVRTADALWFDVIISGYTPSPTIHSKVKKTSLWAENTVKIFEFLDNQKALDFAKQEYKILIWAEITDSSLSILNLEKIIDFKENKDIAIVFGNEVEWVIPATLQKLDYVFHIPMNGQKESLNVWQSSAIFMYEIFRIQNL